MTSNRNNPSVLRVLCVDDNHDLADSVGTLLELVGFDVRVCYDGFSAVQEAREFLPHVCLVDLQMPGIEFGIGPHKRVEFDAISFGDGCRSLAGFNGVSTGRNCRGRGFKEGRWVG